jgi:Zinc knuckle
LDVAPDNYQAVLTGQQSLKGDDLTLFDLERIMNQHYCQLSRGQQGRKEENGEVTAISATCYSCGKKGHMANA